MISQDLQIEDDLDFQYTKSSPEDLLFDQAVEVLQELLREPGFQTLQRQLMQDFKTANKPDFLRYQSLEKLIIERGCEQKYETFFKLVGGREEQVDEQLLDTLLSLRDESKFKALFEDFCQYLQDQQKHKLMTIKSSKKPESKEVKGSIFKVEGVGFSADSLASDFKQIRLKKPKKEEKPEERVLHPDLLLTIKGLRKA